MEFVFVLIGGLIGFASALGIEQVRRWQSTKDRDRRIRRLAGLLYEEVEHVAELLDKDLDTRDRRISVTPSDRERYRAALERVRGNRVIYEAHLAELIELPGCIPNALARFHSRLLVHCNAMEAALDRKDPVNIERVRKQALMEAENLKSKFRESMKERET